MTIVRHGGSWAGYDPSGIAQRDMQDAPTNTSTSAHVAFGQKTKYTLFPVRKSVYGCIE